MRILSKYILKEFSRFFLTSLSAFVVLFVLADFIEKVDDYVEHHAAAWDVIRYTLYEIPNIFFLMTPLAILLATLLTVGYMSKNGEITAMKTSGIPLSRIIAPIFMVSVCLAAVIFWANNTVIPYCNGKAERIKTVKIEKKKMRPSLKHDSLWFRGPKGEIINIGLVEFEGEVPTCYGVTFFTLDKDFRLTGRLDAEEMDWDGSNWIMAKGASYTFSPKGAIDIKKFKDMKVELIERPADFKRVKRLSEEMTFSELGRYIEKLRDEGYNPVKYVVDLYAKLSFTLANVIMVVVAVPFSLKTSRSGGMAVGVGICVILAISYWMFYSFSISLGHAGRFPPLFAAWAPNIVFGATGLYLLLQTDR